ncbi:GTP-binding protein SAR1B [Durusdinium trenchii]|uniref:GTP-binding protein SAR1B n=1 Tax=Durusdinium trenchii TaxID=1381693 RepID=A0ABP0QNA3_9DINO
MLRDGRLSLNAPTLYPNNEELQICGIRFRTFDLGGHETARRIWKETWDVPTDERKKHDGIWKDYLTAVDGVIFLVDAADRTRFEEAAEELGRLLDDPALAKVFKPRAFIQSMVRPSILRGNKIDIPVAASEDELRHSLGLYTHMTSGMGYAEAFDWLAKLVVLACVITLIMEGSGIIKEMLSWSQLWRFMISALMFTAGSGLVLAAYCVGTSPVEVVTFGYSYMPICAVLSYFAFNRRYGRLEWLSVGMLTLGVLAFVLPEPWIPIRQMNGKVTILEVMPESTVRQLKRQLKGWQVCEEELTRKMSKVDLIVGEKQLVDGDETVIQVPNRVRMIEQEAFLGCSSLTSVTIGTSMAIIQAAAFAGCSALARVKLLCAVTRVEDGAFDGCPQIERGLTVEEAKRIGIPGLRR